MNREICDPYRLCVVVKPWRQKKVFLGREFLCLLVGDGHAYQLSKRFERRSDALKYTGKAHMRLMYMRDQVTKVTA